MDIRDLSRPGTLLHETQTRIPSNKIDDVVGPAAKTHRSNFSFKS
jgi:hypothetical protein